MKNIKSFLACFVFPSNGYFQFNIFEVLANILIRIVFDLQERTMQLISLYSLQSGSRLQFNNYLFCNDQTKIFYLFLFIINEIGLIAYLPIVSKLSYPNIQEIVFGTCFWYIVLVVTNKIFVLHAITLLVFFASFLYAFT